jgi:hypothetical protein
VQIPAIEKTAKRFAMGRDALSHRAMKGLRRRLFYRVRRIGVVEHDFRAARQVSQFAKRREH